MKKTSFTIMLTVAILGIITLISVVYKIITNDVDPYAPHDIENYSGYYGGESFPLYSRTYYEGPRMKLTSTPQPYKIPKGAYYDFWDDAGRTPDFTFIIQNSKNGPKLKSINVYHVPTETIWVSYNGPDIKFVTFAHTWH